MVLNTLLGRKIGKRADEAGFNWIFVIIAGAAILLFFFMIVTKQQALTLARTDAQIVRSLETLFATAGIEKNTVSTKELAGIDLSFQCRKRGSSCECSYRSGCCLVMLRTSSCSLR